MSLKQFIRFTNDASIEKTLRLLQGLAQIFAAYALSSQVVDSWLLCRRQFALGRRFLRFFRWVGCFERAWEGLALGGGMGGLERTLVVGKWGFMGLFLGCESVGLLDVMGVYPSDLAKMLLIEGNKFWFYSILFSLTLGSLQLFSLLKASSQLLATKEQSSGAEKSDKKQKRVVSGEVDRTSEERRGIQRTLLADACDLLVPGFVLGWIGVSSAVSAGSGCVSSLISMRDIWEGLQ